MNLKKTIKLGVLISSMAIPHYASGAEEPQKPESENPFVTSDDQVMNQIFGPSEKESGKQKIDQLIDQKPSLDSSNPAFKKVMETDPSKEEGVEADGAQPEDTESDSVREEASETLETSEAVEAVVSADEQPKSEEAPEADTADKISSSELTEVSEDVEGAEDASGAVDAKKELIDAEANSGGEPVPTQKERDKKTFKEEDLTSTSQKAAAKSKQAAALKKRIEDQKKRNEAISKLVSAKEKQAKLDAAEKNKDLVEKIRSTKKQVIKPGANAKALPGSKAVSIGKYQKENVPRVVRYNDDGNGGEVIPDVKTASGGIFFRDAPVENGVAQKIKYVYLSRGAWILKAFQPFIDQLAPEVLKADRMDVTADFIEVSRSLAYLATLIGSDDGSDEMLAAIAKAIAVHREAVSLLKLHWVNASPEVEVVLKRYIDKTFLNGMSPDQMHIEAGSQKSLSHKRILP